METKGLQNVAKSLVLAEKGEFHVYTSSQPRAEIGGTGEDESEVFVPHECFPLLLDGVLDLFEAVAESGKHSFHVAAFFHGDDTSVVFFVHLEKRGRRRERQMRGREGEMDG